MEPIMSFDDAAWAKSEETADAWLEEVQKLHVYIAIKDFILTHRHGTAVELKTIIGGYNISFRLIYDDRSSTILRIPIPGLSRFPEEKIQYEVATMKYLKRNTSIPVPTIIHWGPRAKSPLQLGPFILMEFIEHATTLGDVLNTPGRDENARPCLDSSIDAETLENLYQQMADILLQLSRLSLPMIGALLTDGKDYSVDGRPLSMHWNELVRLGGFPETGLPVTAFPTSSSYLEILADLHIKHLSNQPNDSICSESDCRQKFLARILFRNLARAKKLMPSINEHGPFKIWCDDLRPANVLLDSEYRIVGMIDWEFTYAAPSEFTCTPPWWLLLEKPEFWAEGITSWARAYEAPFRIFLSALRKQEDICIDRGDLKRDQRLSSRMEQEWATGRFWVLYAATRSFAFDVVFRQILDSVYFGSRSSWDECWERRMQLLSPNDRAELEFLVGQKLSAAESKT
jgi:hypothetical protein